MALFDQSTADKSEKATPRRLEEAAKRGQIPRSAEVQTVFVLISGLLALTFFGHEVWQTLELTVAQCLRHLHDLPLSVGMMQGYAVTAALLFARIVGPIVIPVLLGALLAGGRKVDLTPHRKRYRPTGNGSIRRRDLVASSRCGRQHQRRWQ